MKDFEQWDENNLPEGGKNLIVIDNEGNKLFCYRCSCNPNCKTIKCCLSGGTLMINPKKWKYNPESFAPSGPPIDFFELYETRNTTYRRRLTRNT